MARKKEFAKIYITGEVSEGMLQQFNKDFDNAVSRNPSAIVIEISSGGGDVHCGLAIVNRIKASHLPIITLASGLVMSAAVPIFLSGKKRLCRPHTWFLIHALSLSDCHGPTTKVMQEAIQMKRESLEYAQMVSSMSKMTLDEVEDAMTRETYLSPQEAIEKGMVDEICEHD